MVRVRSLPGREWTLYSVRLRISLGVLEIRKTATGIIHSLCNSPPSLVQQGSALIGREVQSVATPAIWCYKEQVRTSKDTTLVLYGIRRRSKNTMKLSTNESRALLDLDQWEWRPLTWLGEITRGWHISISSVVGGLIGLSCITSDQIRNLAAPSRGGYSDSEVWRRCIEDIQHNIIHTMSDVIKVNAI